MIVGMADEMDIYAGVPLYVQVARIIEAEIRAGQWEPGNVVPSRTSLAQRFNVAAEPVTVNAAQLASWHGAASKEALNLDGPCPRASMTRRTRFPSSSPPWRQ
jgi:DNA-binding transcriptional MocR family regulator